MQAEILLALTCAGYVAPYAWDRLRTRRGKYLPTIQIDTSALREVNAEIDRAIAQVRRHARSSPSEPGFFEIMTAAHRAGNDPGKRYADVLADMYAFPSRLTFPNHDTRERLAESMSNAMQNAGRSVILSGSPEQYTSLYDADYQPHCSTCEQIERSAGRRIEYCIGEFTRYPAGSY